MTQDDITIVTELCELRQRYKELQTENERLTKDAKNLLINASAIVKADVLRILEKLPNEKYVTLVSIKNILAEYLSA